MTREMSQTAQQASSLPSKPDASPRQRLVLVDGSGYIFRAYHALPPLTRRDGTPVGAVYGFTNMLMKLRETQQAAAFAVIFDATRLTFRNEIYADYKANRDETPEDLIPQFALVREATDALNLPRIELEHYEADDLIAAYARRATEAGMEVMIVSSDKDLMQLITPDVFLYDPMKQRELREEAVMEKFGVAPNQVIEVQALIGDSVDNVPGVPGIGPKTAAQLILEFGSLEGLLANLDQIKQPKRRASLEEHADNARLSYQLVQLKDDLELPAPIETLNMKPVEPEALLSFLRQNEFKALIKKLEQQTGISAADIAPAEEDQPQGESAHPAFQRGTYELVQTKAALAQWVEEARRAGRVAVDTETTSLNARQAELVGVSLCIAPGKACYVPLQHRQAITRAAAQGQLFGESDETADAQSEWALAEGQMALEDALEVLRPMLADPAVLKIGQNIKYDMQVLKRYDVEVSPVDDTMLLSYVSSAGLHAHNMDELSERYLNHRPIAFKDVVGSGKQQKNFADLTPQEALDYAAEDAEITACLHPVLQRQMMDRGVVSVYESIERPLIPVIVGMEREGIRVSPEKLKAMSKEFQDKIEALETIIHEQAGRAFNIGSPKQLGEILFDEMGLSGGKKSSKTGAYATGAEVLEELAATGIELAQNVLQWRQLSKLKSTYTDALVREIHPETGRVHTSFSLAATTTGRLSSSEPNLQNIPIRTEEGKRIREAFVAEEGCRLISADYSQIELRLLAHIAEIDTLKAAFKDGRDIHATTASQMFGEPIESVSSELRRKAKTINFGIIYGISAHGLATRLGIGRAEAADYINAYFEQYPGIRRYMEDTKQLAREQGYVSTLFGRKVHVKDIQAKNPNLRAFSERAAINAPLQGTAADIIKRAMIQVDALLRARFPQARLLLQVHDELIVEAPVAQAQQVADAVKQAMSGAARLSVPLLVEAGVGQHWGEIH